MAGTSSTSTMTGTVHLSTPYFRNSTEVVHLVGPMAQDIYDTRYNIEPAVQQMLNSVKLDFKNKPFSHL